MTETEPETERWSRSWPGRKDGLPEPDLVLVQSRLRVIENRLAEVEHQTRFLRGSLVGTAFVLLALLALVLFG